MAPPPPAAPPGPTVDALSSAKQRSGPPGVGLDLSGSGYTDCDAVYYFFDGVRIGMDHPDDKGAVGSAGLAVPGDADPGPHQITTSCRPTGKVVKASTTFLVTDTSLHRSAFVTSLAQPGQVPTNSTALITSAIVAVALLLLLAFPAELFNSTLEENYDEVRAWFRLPARVIDATTQRRRVLSFGILLLLGGVVYAGLSPGFGVNMTTVALIVGMTAALLIMSLVFSLPADISVHRRTGEWGSLNVLPGSIVVAALCVALSRLLHFQPGYLYGVLAGFAFRSRLSATYEGRITAANWLFGLAISVAAWLARTPVSTAAGKPGASLLVIGLEACLATVFLIGVETLIVAMLPMRFLDGRKVLQWSRPAWAVLFTLGLFAMIHVLLRPGAGYVGHTSGSTAITVGLLYAVFGVISVGFWAYFRYRPRRLVPGQARS